MAYTYFFIFAAMRKLKSDLSSLDKEYASALTETLANPAHLTSFILVVFFWVSWLPFLLITFLEYLAQWKIQVTTPLNSVFCAYRLLDKITSHLKCMEAVEPLGVGIFENRTTPAP